MLPDPETMQSLEQFTHTILEWIGFGIVVGLAAKALMPGKDPGGAIGTMLMGVGGTVMGCGTVMFFWQAERVTPISIVGFIAATMGAFAILFFYKLLSGTWFAEAEDGDQWWHRQRRRRRRRRLAR